jgi:2'-5' RNA ligase
VIFAMSRGASARLFVAVDPPAAVREELSAWARAAMLASGPRATEAAGAGPRPAAARSARGAGRGREDRRPSTRATRRLRLLEPGVLHLTLIFLGNRPVGEIEAIGAALHEHRAAVGELSVGAPLWLPPRRPRALAVEIRDPAGELSRLQATLSGAIAEATGWEPERRRFRAHITVVRVSGRAAGDANPELIEHLPPTPRLHFTPPTIVLYRSRLSPQGAAYEAVTTCELDRAAP